MFTGMIVDPDTPYDGRIVESPEETLHLNYLAEDATYLHSHVLGHRRPRVMQISVSVVHATYTFMELQQGASKTGYWLPSGCDKDWLIKQLVERYASDR